jgi:hypothetical protein
VAFHVKATAPLAPIAGISVDWVIFGAVMALVAGMFILFGQRQHRFNKQQNCEIAEKLAARPPPSSIILKSTALLMSAELARPSKPVKDRSSGGNSSLADSWAISTEIPNRRSRNIYGVFQGF